MNWYKTLKLAHQQLGLYGQDPENDEPFQGQQRPLINPDSVPNEDTRFSGNLLTDLEWWTDYEFLLDHYNVDYDKIDLAGKNYYVFDYGGDRYILDSDGRYEEAQEWISGIYDPFQYIDARDFNKEFWDEIGEGSVLYHATDPSNLKSILRNGLQLGDRTRGIANRNTGAAVFTSYSPEAVDVYGAAKIAIYVGKMKADGYMPTVSIEGPIEEYEAYEALAHKLGIEYSNDIESGIDADTVIFFDNIPAKYIKQLS